VALWLKCLLRYLHVNIHESAFTTFYYFSYAEKGIFTSEKGKHMKNSIKLHTYIDDTNHMDGIQIDNIALDSQSKANSKRTAHFIG